MNNKVVKPTKFENVRLFLHLPRKVFWYWDIRLYAPFILILFIVMLIMFTSSNNSTISESKSVEVVAKLVEDDIEPSIEVPTEPEMDSEIVLLARLADSVAAHKSDEVKKIIMWVAINRAEDRSNGYGSGLRGEIARPKQWQCYDPYATYLQSTYDIAEEVYNTWMSGGPRPMYPDMLWFVFNSDGSITVRNQFKEGKNRVEMTFGQ